MGQFLLISIVMFLTYLFGSKAAPPAPRIQAMSMVEGVHVEKLVLPAGQGHLRVSLETTGVQGNYNWKALSWVRNKATWIEPTLYQLDQHPLLASSLLILKSPDGNETTVVYPVATLEANHDLMYQDNLIKANIRRVRGDGDHEVYAVIVHSKGGAEKDLVKVAVEKARELVGGSPKDDSPEGFFKGLGVCTWEALRGKGLPTIQALLDLVPKDIPIQTFLIDDGWQDRSSQRGLISFHEHPKMGAPMSEVVSKLKAKNVPAVGVWVTLQGYWIGIDKNSSFIKTYNCQEHPRAEYDQPRGGVVIPLKTRWNKTEWLPHPDKAEQFWLDYFNEIKSWGIDFVKVDNQATGETIVGEKADLALSAMWSGMLSAADKVFGIEKIINCMAHHERMLNGPGGLDFSRPKGNLVFRNSDDFNLRYDMADPDFIKWNLYSTILTSHLSLIPDFDMFSSAEHLPIPQALLRVLGPGPLLLSDSVDVQTNKTLLNRMVSGPINLAVRTPRAASVLPTRWHLDNLQSEGSGPALIAGVSLPEGSGAIIGAWNIRNPNTGAVAHDVITNEDIQTLVPLGENGGEYVLFTLSLAGMPKEIPRFPRDEGFKVELMKGECESIVVARIWKIGTEEKKKEVAVLGMLDKLAPLAQIHVEEQDGSVVVISAFKEPVSVLALGEPGSIKQVSAHVDGKSINSVKKDVPGGVVYTFEAQEAGSKFILS